MKILSVKKRELNCYDVFHELKLDNGEYIMFNDYHGVDDNEMICIYKESVIDKIEDDTFWEQIDEYIVDDVEEKKVSKDCTDLILSYYNMSKELEELVLEMSTREWEFDFDSERLYFILGNAEIEIMLKENEKICGYGAYRDMNMTELLEEVKTW